MDTSSAPLPRESLSPAVLTALIALTILAGLYLAWPIWRATLPLQIDVNEAWNAYHADSIRDSLPLYPNPDGLVINNYPPLSFYVLAGLSALGVDPVYGGRLISLIALAALTGAIASLIRQFRASEMAAFLGAIWFCATMARFINSYVGMNDPSLPTVALMTWGLVWLLRRQARGHAADPAIALIAVAGFYKHNYLAIPLTAILWVATSDRWAAVRAALVGAGAVALGLALCIELYGWVFVQSLLMAREYSLISGLGRLGRLQWIAPALVIIFVWAWNRRGSETVRFSIIFVAIAFGTYFLQCLGAGVDDNAQFEVIIAAAVGLGFAFGGVAAIPAMPWFTLERQRLTILIVVIVRLLLSLRTAPYLLVESPAFRAELHERAAVTQREIARVAAIPGPVICDLDLVCRWAGKPKLIDSFFLAQSVATGRRTQAQVDRLQQALGALHVRVDPRAFAEWP